MFIYIKMDSELNNLQRLICYKTQKVSSVTNLSAVKGQKSQRTPFKYTIT